MDKTINCGLDYVLDCIARSRTNFHWAYVTEEVKIELLKRGFQVIQPDPRRLAKIRWARLEKIG
jgi:hypothetical protein